MRHKYQDLASREVDLVRELREIDSLLPDDTHQNFQAYPQLFQDDDSLFKPDSIFETEIEKPSKPPIMMCEESDTFNNKNEELFEEYLDTFEANEFIEMKNNKHTKNLHLTHSKKVDSLECTFKPSILKKSTLLAGNLKPAFQRLTDTKPSHKQKAPYKPQDSQIKKQYSKERIQRLSKPRNLKTQPHIKKQVQVIKKQRKNRILVDDPNYLDVAARNALWEEQKKNKLERLRKQESENQLKKERSSFTPKILEYKGGKQANLTDFGKQGIANYFERVSQANKKIGNKNNSYSNTQESLSPYSSRPNNSKTPKKQNYNNENVRGTYQNKNRKKGNTRKKYQEAVQQLHKKLMNLQI